MSAAPGLDRAESHGTWLRKVVGDSSWVFSGQTVKIGAQGGFFVLLARSLGSREFGLLAAALAVVAIAVPFAGWGAGSLMVMRTARDASAFGVAFGSSLLMIALSGVALSVVTSAVSTALIGRISLQLAAEVALADLVFARVADTCSQACQGFGRLAMSARLATIPALLRLGAAAGFVSLGGSTARGWGPWYLGASALSALVAAPVVLGRLGWPILRVSDARGQLKQGFFFAVGASSATIYNDIDKTMVARLSTLEAAGVYAAASRAVGMAFTPILSVFTATYYRFFVHGADGVRGTLKLARRLASPVLALGLLAAAGLWFAAPLAPRVLGGDFASATSALRWLALVPLFQAIFYLAGDVLTGAGHQGLRSGVQLGAAGLNIALNFWLIPAYSWRGAAAATIATDVALAGALWIAVVAVSRRGRAVPVPVTA
jgi:O-antigen/teichoic acid export membrane protein